MCVADKCPSCINVRYNLPWLALQHINRKKKITRGSRYRYIFSSYKKKRNENGAECNLLSHANLWIITRPFHYPWRTNVYPQPRSCPDSVFPWSLKSVIRSYCSTNDELRDMHTYIIRWGQAQIAITAYAVLGIVYASMLAWREGAKRISKFRRTCGLRNAMWRHIRIIVMLGEGEMIIP